MGMYGALRRLSKEELARLKEKPELTTRLTDPDDEEFGWTESWPSGSVLDLDKSWQVLHFALTGDAWGGTLPLKNAVLGGTPIGPPLGYDPAHYVAPEDVVAVATALASLTEDAVKSRLDPDVLEAAEVYPGPWKPRPPPPKRRLFGRTSPPLGREDPGAQSKELADYFGFVMDRFRDLVRFYRDVSTAGDAVLGWLA